MERTEYTLAKMERLDLLRHDIEESTTDRPETAVPSLPELVANAVRRGTIHYRRNACGTTLIGLAKLVDTCVHCVEAAFSTEHVPRRHRELIIEELSVMEDLLAAAFTGELAFRKRNPVWDLVCYACREIQGIHLHCFEWLFIAKTSPLRHNGKFWLALARYLIRHALIVIAGLRYTAMLRWLNRGQRHAESKALREAVNLTGLPYPARLYALRDFYTNGPGKGVAFLVEYEAWIMARVRLALQALELERYRDSHGAFPKSLASVTTFTDPYGRTEFGFSIDERGYSLSSVGPGRLDRARDYPYDPIGPLPEICTFSVNRE